MLLPSLPHTPIYGTGMWVPRDRDRLHVLVSRVTASTAATVGGYGGLSVY